MGHDWRRCVARQGHHQKVARAGRGGKVAWRFGPLLVLVVMLGACAGPTGWIKVESPRELAWVDDGSALRLSKAIGGSIDYYRRLPEGTEFHFDDLVYSPREMIASLEFFRDLYLGAPDAVALQAALDKHFHVFESIREGGAEDNLFTAYYEPELEAAETPSPGLETPLFALPQDMVRIRLDRFGETLPKKTLVGRVVEGELVPYHTREEIQRKDVLGESNAPIAYVNEVDLFFLQIQGSGVLRFPDNRLVKVGYAGSNGHPYRSIGGLLVRRNDIPLEDLTMQSIRAYLEANPGEVRELLFANPSYVFFQVLEDGPYGNIRVALTPGRSLALDHRLFPKGALAYVETEVADPNGSGATIPWRRFMLVQDTGGAIRGHGRGDLFLGAGKRAEWQAGHQKHGGRLFLLVATKKSLADRMASNN